MSWTHGRNRKAKSKCISEIYRLLDEVGNSSSKPFVFMFWRIFHAFRGNQRATRKWWKSVPKVPQNVARIKVFLHDFDSSSKPFVPQNYFNFEGSFDLGKHNHTSKEFLWDFLETLANIKGCPEMKTLETIVMIMKTSYVHTCYMYIRMHTYGGGTGSPPAVIGVEGGGAGGRGRHRGGKMRMTSSSQLVSVNCCRV